MITYYQNVFTARQNQNESYNATVWDRIPKTTFVELKTFEIGVYDAVAHFNIGNTATTYHCWM